MSFIEIQTVRTAIDHNYTLFYRKCLLLKKKKALYLSVNVFSTKVLIVDTNFTSPNGDGAAILRGHPSHAKV